MVAIFLRILGLLCLCFVNIQAKSFVKLCYFPNWAHQRVSEFSRFDVEQVDPSLCTHLVYAFAVMDVSQQRLLPKYSDEDTTGVSSGRYQRFNDLKKKNSLLKTLLSIGGEYAGSQNFLDIAMDDGKLQKFATNAVDFLRKHNFDGLDIDWEYPDAEARVYFSRLIKTLRTTFESEQTSSGRERLLLTVALPAGKQRIQDGFNVTALNRYVDLASLMTYDYHGGWNKVTGFDSPLFSRNSNIQFNSELSTEWTVNFYISLGLEASKIAVGITAAGTHFKLQDHNVTGVGAPVIQGDQRSPLWELNNRFSYPEICQVLHNGSVRVFDEEQQVPYTFQNGDWFGYEDVQSVQRKADWIAQKGVAGAMFWALDMDDFAGKLCNNGAYPMLRALGQRLGKHDVSDSNGSLGKHDVSDSNGSLSHLSAHFSAAWLLCLVAALWLQTSWDYVVKRLLADE